MNASVLQKGLHAELEKSSFLLKSNSDQPPKDV
jgi:hypothetical protein